MGEKRTNSRFTDSEVEILRQNKYTQSVTNASIRFTPEFRKIYWTEYSESGYTNTYILKKYGYDPQIIGPVRMRSLLQSVKQEFSSNQVKVARRRPFSLDEETLDETQETTTLKELCHKVKYLEAEIDFLKKIISPANTRK